MKSYRPKTITDRPKAAENHTLPYRKHRSNLSCCIPLHRSLSSPEMSSPTFLPFTSSEDTTKLCDNGDTKRRNSLSSSLSSGVSSTPLGQDPISEPNDCFVSRSDEIVQPDNTDDNNRTLNEKHGLCSTIQDKTDSISGDRLRNNGSQSDILPTDGRVGDKPQTDSMYRQRLDRPHGGAVAFLHDKFKSRIPSQLVRRIASFSGTRYVLLYYSLRYLTTITLESK